MKKDRQLGVGKVGMNKDVHNASLDEKTYTHALNSNLQGQDGDNLSLQNEESNILCSNFPQGFKVIGIEKDITADRTYFCLVNPTTGESEIGYIAELEDQISFQDTIKECGCDIKTVLADGLESIDQTETCTYVSIIKDYSCPNTATPNKCLNFNINYPVDLELRDEKCGKVLYFTDDLNPIRRLELKEENLTQYYKRTEFCTDEDPSDPDYNEDCDCGTVEVDTCLNCDKLSVKPSHKPLCIEVEGLVNGGQVKHGQYAFFVGYSDSVGNMITDYLAATSKVSVKDPNVNIYQQPQLDAVTNFSVKLSLSNLDSSFEYYQVAVLDRSSVDGANAFFSVGIFPTSTKQVLYSGSQNLSRLSQDMITAQLPEYLLAKTVTQANNILFLSDLEARPDPNLQPVVNFMGHFAKWRTVRADETIYQDAKGVANFTGYMRDEVVPFSIRFLTNKGYKTPLYPLIPRAATTQDELFDGVSSLAEQQSIIDGFDTVAPELGDGWRYDVYSVLETGNGLCTSELRNKKWQFYNTAPESTIESIFNNCGGEDEDPVSKNLRKKCIVSKDITIDFSTPIELNNFEEGDTFTTFLQYIRNNDGNLPAEIQDPLDAARLEGGVDYLDCCDGDTLFDNCGLAQKIQESELRFNSLKPQTAGDTLTIDISYYLCNSGKYNRLKSNDSCDNVYILAFTDKGEPKGQQLNYEGAYDLWLKNPTGLCSSSDYPAYFERIPNYLNNTNPGSAVVLNPIPYDNISGNFNIIPIFPDKSSATTESTLLTSIDSAPLTLSTPYFANLVPRCFDRCSYLNTDVNLTFNLKVHKNAVWYQVNNIDTDFIVLNFSKVKLPGDKFKDCLIYSPELRLSIYDTNFNLLKEPSGPSSTNCGGAYYPKLIDVFTNNHGDGVYYVDTTGINTIYFAIDAPIAEVVGYNPTDPPLYLTGTVNCIDFGVHIPSIKKITISGDGLFDLNIQKTCIFEAICQVPSDTDIKCNPTPWEQGSFAYWESTVNYPNNDFLYNSAQMVGDISTLSFDNSAYLTEFNNAFVNSAGELDPAKADFTCQPIRHFKFPDFPIAPTIDGQTSIGQSNKVYPIGFYLDNDIISSFLDLAVTNDLISQEFRDTITHYEIFRGDTRLNRSIVAKGLTFDMFQYTETGSSLNERTFFANFPYNDLSENKLLYKDKNREEFVTHPDTEEYSNQRYLFHSPETSYEKPALPFELYVETYMKGHSRGVFTEVQRHPTMVVLTDRAFRLSKILATVEIVLDGITKISELVGNLVVGTSTNVGVAVATSLYSASYFASSFARGRLKVEEWLTIFSNLSKPNNFAYYYTSVGNYNSYLDVREQGNITRGLGERQYLNSGRYRFNENGETQPTVINHFNRESGVYVYTPQNLGLPSLVIGEDDSRSVASEYGCRDSITTPEYTSAISSPYVSLKEYIPDQYGSINNIKWIHTGYCGQLSQDNSCDVVFGGDTFLSRFYFKRKFPFFINNMIEGNDTLPDLVPFNYTQQRNVGYPRYFVNYLTTEEDSGKFLGVAMRAPFQASDYNFDCLDTQNSRGKQALSVQEGSKFYLWYYGIPGFIVESRVNNNFRYGRDNRAEDFYPNQSDYVAWTQEKNVSAREDNYYFYNNIYSSENDIYAYRTLPDNYDPEEWNCRFNHWDRTIYSLPDNNEQDLLDNFRVFRANNYYDFGNKYGDFYGLVQIEQQKVIGRFENGLVIFNAFSTLEASTETFAVGSGNIFNNRPTDFYQTELGYGGTQHRAWVSCEYGHFWTDAKRGRVYHISPSGGGLREVSNRGMYNWFRENLPFRIKKQFPNIPNDMLDNAYNGLGITMTWDDRYRRVFITKKDVKVKEEYLSQVTIRDLDFYLEDKLIHPEEDSQYFEDCSWTVAFRPAYNQDLEGWVSFYAFKPNYYVSHQNYFSSGLNFSSGKGLWNHLLGNNQTFQVFYGDLYPWTIEVPVQTNYQTKFYEDFSYRLDVRRYKNEYDYSHYDQNFSEAVFYTDRESTGRLKFITRNPNDQRQSIMYPNYTPTGVEVLATKEDYVWSTNYFFDNIRDNHTQPIWLNALNNVEKELNPTAFNYRSEYKNHIRGQYMRARLIQNQESRFKYIFEFFVADGTMYDAY